MKENSKSKESTADDAQQIKEDAPEPFVEEVSEPLDEKYIRSTYTYEELAQNSELFSKLMSILSFVEKSRQEILTVYKNVDGLGIHEQVLNHYTDGFHDICIAFGFEGLTDEERYDKLVHSHEHFLLYLTESWEIVVVEMLEFLTTYIEDYKKPIFCPRNTYNKFRTSVLAKCERYFKEIKIIRLKKIVSEKIAWDTVANLKIMYDKIYDFIESLTIRRDYPPLQDMNEIVTQRFNRRQILVKVLVPIGVAILSFILGWFVKR